MIFLNYIFADFPSDHAIIRLRDGVDPGDMPKIVPWIIDAQRGAVQTAARRNLGVLPLAA